MQLTRRLTSFALATVIIAAGAAPAAMAKRVKYAGKTRDGDPMSFTLVGDKLTNLKAYVPTLCGSTEGVPSTAPIRSTRPGRSRSRAPQE